MATVGGSLEPDSHPLEGYQPERDHATQERSQRHLNPGALDLKLGRDLGPGGTVDAKAGELEQGFGAELDLERAIDVDVTPENALEGAVCHPTMHIGPTEPPNTYQPGHNQQQAHGQDTQQHPHAVPLPGPLMASVPSLHRQWWHSYRRRGHLPSWTFDQLAERHTLFFVSVPQPWEHAIHDEPYIGPTMIWPQSASAADAHSRIDA
jgi:hypothetical protein